MKITCDTSKLVRQLEQFKKDNVRKLQSMVAGFAYTVTIAASDNTPVGDDEALQNNEVYRSFYLSRNETFGIDVAVGFHAGAWRYDENGAYVFDENIYEYEQTTGQALQDARANYKLGDTFYIMAVGPGYKALEEGYSPKARSGIMQPAIDQIMSTYKINLKQFYEGA